MIVGITINQHEDIIVAFKNKVCQLKLITGTNPAQYKMVEFWRLPTKSRTKKDELAVQEVFNHWNGFKRKNWHSHPSLSADISEAIKGVFAQGYTKEQINKAIDNYVLVMFAPEYAVFNNGKKSWNKTWTLREFLSRSTSHDRKEKYMWRFLESNFRAEDFETVKKKQAKVEIAKAKAKKAEATGESLTLEEKQAIKKKVRGW